MIEANILLDIGIIVIVAAIGAIISKSLKQPLILGYVLSGILVGPAVLGLIKNTSLLLTLSELGIAFLLFFVGLELDFSKLKKLGLTVSILGVVQVALITLIGALVASNWFGFVPSLYIGLILAFSSTMIVIKLLSDRREIDTLHGRLILGILLIQDILIVLILPFLTTLGETSLTAILFAILKILALFLVAFISKEYIFKRLMKYITDSAEVLFITSVALCFAFIAFAYILGFSIAIGGFIAGMALATRPYNLEIAGRVKSLKDFFAVLFFVTLGSQLSFFGLERYVYLFIALIAIALILKPIIIFIILKLFKYSNRASILVSSSLGQISEFSLILAVSGLALGHLTQEIFTLTVLIAIVTITITSYFIQYSDGVYRIFSRVLVPFESFTSAQKDLEKVPKKITNHTVIFGADRMGSQIIDIYEKRKEKLIIVDYNPEVIRKLINKGYNCIYGDYTNPEILEALRLDKAKIIISTIPSADENFVLIELIKGLNKKAVLLVTTKTLTESLNLYDAGADFVILPQVVAGQKVTEYLKKFDISALKRRGDFYHKKLRKERKRNDIID